MKNLALKLVLFWPLLAVIAIGIILRLLRLEELFYFTYDESIPAFVGRRLLLWTHVPLIGGATPFGFHLGPYFYWFYSLLLFAGRLNPLVWGIASAAISGLTILLMFSVGNMTGSKKTAITAAIFWSLSVLANIYDRHLWALFWGPLLSLITIYSLVRLKQGKNIWLYILAVSLALGVHADLSNLIFVGLSFLSFLIFKIPKFPKSFVVISGVVLLSFLPLVVFDLRHDFANSRPALNFFQQGRNNPGFTASKFVDNNLLFPRTLSRLFYKYGDNEVPKDYSYCPVFIKEKNTAIPLVIVTLASLMSVVFVACSFKSKSMVIKLAALTFVLYFVGIQIYGTILKADIFEHYLTGLFPIFLLGGAFLLSKLPKPIWLLSIAVFSFLNIYKFARFENSMGLKNKRLAIEYVQKEIGSENFSVDSLSTCWKYSGYRYLFTVFGREPVKSYVDPNFAYLYGTTAVSPQHPKRIVSFVVHDFVPESELFYQRYSLLKSHEIKSKLFGNLEVIIVDNSTGWF